jgi:hypothetical protein
MFTFFYIYFDKISPENRPVITLLVNVG